MSALAGSVLVVGAGPAGASLAYVLASRGVRVTLVERQRDFAREFRGEVLLPSGGEALHQMGLGRVVPSIPHVAPTAIALYANTRPIFHLPVEPAFVGRYPPTAVSQPAFLEAVIRAASAHSCFKVELGATVTGLLRTNGRVSGVTVRDQDGEQELRADVVVGADGRSSVIRRECGLEVRKHGLDVDVVWCKLPLPSFLSADAPVRVYIGRAHLLIAYRAADGLLQVAWVIIKGTYGELRRRGIEDWLEEMAHHVTPDLGDHLRANRDALTHPFLLTAVSDRVTRWSEAGALVIGDAAHTMSPVGGQGINIALRDAVVAANYLVPTLSRDPTAERVDAATQAVEDARLPEVAYIQRLQAFPPRLLMGHTWWAAVFRAIAPRLLRFEIARRQAAPIARTILFGHGEVRLRI